MPHTAPTKANGDLKECIDNCLECQGICLETVMYCLQKGGAHADAAHIRLVLDCADICRTSADFLLRARSSTRAPAASAPKSASAAQRTATASARTER